MATVTYSATLNTYGDAYWLGNNRATQGCYDDTRYTGIMYFPQMNLKGKTINSVSLTITSAKAGPAATKTVPIYHSSVQGIDTSLIGAAHRKGASIGSISGMFYNNTLTVSANILKSAISEGEKTFLIYVADSRYAHTYSENYLIFDSVTITVDYEEPATPPTDPPVTPPTEEPETPPTTPTIITPTAPTSITPAHGTLTYYNTVKPTITWSGATNAVKYVVERAISSNIHLDSWNAIAETTKQTFTDTSLGMSQGYYVRYRVKAISSTDTASAYRTSGNIRRMLPVIAPKNVSAVVAENDNVFITWDADTAPFATFVVQLSTDEGESWSDLTAVTESELFIKTFDVPSGPTIFRVRCDQVSVDSDETLHSPYGLSNSVVVPGGLWLQANDEVVRGRASVKSASVFLKARKVFAKVDDVWRESK